MCPTITYAYLYTSPGRTWKTTKKKINKNTFDVSHLRRRRGELSNLTVSRPKEGATESKEKVIQDKNEFSTLTEIFLFFFRTLTEAVCHMLGQSRSAWMLNAGVSLAPDLLLLSLKQYIAILMRARELRPLDPWRLYNRERNNLVNYSKKLGVTCNQSLCNWSAGCAAFFLLA